MNIPYPGNTSGWDTAEEDRFILRDKLAIHRTLLANERTLLAYLRSGVSLLIAGVSIIHFGQQGWFFCVGMLCIPSGVITSLFGLKRFYEMKKMIALDEADEAKAGLGRKGSGKKERGEHGP